MLIKEITLEDQKRSDTDQRTFLVLCVHCSDKHIQMSCVVCDSEITGGNFWSVVAEKIVDQLMKFPEVRSGRVKITVASDLILHNPLAA